MGRTGELHKLLNKERTKRGLSYLRWNNNLGRGCREHSDYMLKAHRLDHAPIEDMPNGGECICGGRGNHSPRDFVKSWMGSSGHKELILNPNLRSQAVAISGGSQNKYATWRGSTQGVERRQFKNPFRILLRRRPVAINPLRVGVSIVLGCVGLLGMVLGAHGAYVYFNRLELLFGGEGAKLFLAMDVPVRLREAVVWASERGLQSWFIPVVIFVAGLGLFGYSGLWERVSRLFEKIRP